jgi:Polyketide cyclase / dehydrase and lipid transport
VLHRCEASMVVGAAPRAVWDVVSDVTRVGEWSGECRGCVWVGAQAAEPGARFVGRNRRGAMKWTRMNEVVQADAPHVLVWRTIPRFPYPDSVEWQLRLTPVEKGTLVTESFQVLHLPRVMEWLVGMAMPAHRDRSADLTDDLDRLRVLVESGVPR